MLRTNVRDVAVTYMVPRAWADSPGRVLQLLGILKLDVLRRFTADMLRTLNDLLGRFTADMLRTLELLDGLPL